MKVLVYADGERPALLIEAENETDKAVLECIDNSDIEWEASDDMGAARITIK